MKYFVSNKTRCILQAERRGYSPEIKKDNTMTNPTQGERIETIPSDWEFISQNSNQYETVRTFHTDTHVVDVDQDNEVVFSQPHNHRSHIQMG